MKKLSLSSLILLAVVFGLAAGLFFGEWCRHLEIVGRAFIAIMQISVLPYIFVSLIQSFGSLDPQQAKLLAKRGIVMILLMWGVVFALMALMPLTFPQWQSGSFFSPSILSSGEPVDYIQLFIPANPFNSLANNTVPAVTIFSILCGVVLMGIRRKQNLLNLLEISSEVLSRLTLMLVKLSPIGIFALVAKAAGTMRLEDIGRVEVYLAAYLLMGALLFFLILPLVLTMFTPFRYREIMSVGREAMLTVLLTGNLFIVLPLLVENIEKLFKRHSILTDEGEAMARIIVPITFILPCAGQLMDLVFILFAGWFSNESFGLAGYLELFGAGLLTSFGSAKVAIPFLLGMFHLPSDLFEIFLFSSVITDNVKFTVEAAAVLVFSALFVAWMTGRVRWNWRRLWSRLAVIVIVIGVSLFVLYLGMNRLLPEPKDQRLVLNAMKIEPSVPFEVFNRLPAAPPLAAGSQLDQIRRSGVLRVGYNRDGIPFTFFNDRGELVGFDVAMAHKLAADLGCRRIEFYPVEYDELETVLNDNLVDIAMCEISISAERLGKVGFTDHYLELSMALLVPDYLKTLLRQDPSRLEDPRFAIAALEGADYERLEQLSFRGKAVELAGYDAFFSGEAKADALLIAAENGSALTIMHPEYDLFIPARQYKDLVAYAVPLDDQRFIEYLNFWLALKRSNGEIDEEYDYWIRGVDVEKLPPRWSVLQNVILPKIAAGD
ncbi:cation:dicarboxylase symporter family transporter [Victivallis sp. Marseille-Q1083]|uniref:cation:dicarboxylate symporter family transporter n=1 Tax=Victivallis sp. Marseille-Q1083 TaxID=2717288 RepID=UPI00158BDD3A|nr:cation:dicarboxylase symporter family transporter [Victivallis sp. Marseille-Q1083]